MAEVMFGYHQLCPDCQGTGLRTALNDAEKRERSRVLRIAKRRGEPPPKIVQGACFNCSGRGFAVRAKGT